MELDDLKNSWKKTELKTNKNVDIMELIQHKSYGPVAALKRDQKTGIDNGLNALHTDQQQHEQCR
jgi:hypothetical protein